MKINEFTALVGKNLVLVPYRQSHVVRYHEFMSDSAVREATASEEISLLEEYEMQASWRNDDDKLTFIMLKRGKDSSLDPLTSTSLAQLDAPENMIGDVNLFLSDAYESDEDEDTPSSTLESKPPPIKRAEIELMIALISARRSGYGLESIQLFLSYASDILGLKPFQFFAKIGIDNLGSIKLFERLGFVKGKISEIFQEVEMIWGGTVDEKWCWEKGYEMIEYLE